MLAIKLELDGEPEEKRRFIQIFLQEIRSHYNFDNVLIDINAETKKLTVTATS